MRLYYDARLKCPECEASIQVELGPDPRVNDMADLSRENRMARGFAVRCGECGYEADPLEFDPRSRLPKVVKCYITSMGQVIAFDAEGKQVPECQGFILVVASELKFRCDGKTKWFMREETKQDTDFSWWFTERA